MEHASSKSHDKSPNEPFSHFNLTVDNKYPVGITSYDDKFWIVDKGRSSDLTSAKVFVYDANGVPLDHLGFDLHLQYDDFKPPLPRNDNFRPLDIAYGNDKFWVVAKQDRGSGVEYVFAYYTNGTRDDSNDFELHPSNTSPNSMSFYDNKLFVLNYNYQNPKIFVYNADGKDLSFEFVTNIRSSIDGMTILGDKVWIRSYSDVYVFDFEGHRLSGFDFDMPRITSSISGSGMTYYDNKFWFTLDQGSVVSYEPEDSFVSLDVSAFNDFDGDGKRDIGDTSAGGITVLIYTPATKDIGVVTPYQYGSKTLHTTPNTFYAFAIPLNGEDITTPLYKHDGAVYVGMIKVENPDAFSVHKMEIGIKKDPCIEIIPDGHFAATILGCDHAKPGSPTMDQRTDSPHDDSYIVIKNHKSSYTTGDVITAVLYIDQPNYVNDRATQHLDYGMLLVSGASDNTLSSNDFDGAGYLGKLFGPAVFDVSDAKDELYGPGFYCNGAADNFDLKFDRSTNLITNKYNSWNTTNQGVACPILPNTANTYTVTITDNLKPGDYSFVIGTDPNRGFMTPEFSIN